jgi:hypothetical protein
MVGMTSNVIVSVEKSDFWAKIDIFYINFRIKEGLADGVLNIFRIT